MRIWIPFMLCACLCACTKQGEQSGDTAIKNILTACPGFAETGKPALVYGAQCGKLSVKEDPADPNSRDISLNILRLPAISPTPKQDPLFLIQGGPGGSSVQMAALVYGAFNDVRKNRDLIFVDQRGTGKSNPLNCEHISDIDMLLSEIEQQQKYLELMTACATKFAPQLPFYTTPFAAQDLDAVRSALGYNTINLWGVSYGTRVVLEYMREFPLRVRAVILDGVAPVQIALPKYFSADALLALNSVNLDCQSNLQCSAQFGDIVAKAQQVAARLHAAQSMDKPVSVQFEHPRYKKITHLMLTPGIFSDVIFMSLYSRELTVLLPNAIADAERGDYRLIAVLFTLASEQAAFTGISEGMRYSVVCNEDAHFIADDDVKHERDFFGKNMLQQFAEVCRHWPKAVLPEHYFEPIKSDVPTLLLSGNHDPVTPARWADAVARHLTHQRQIVAPGGNHSISMEGCLPKIIAQFIEVGSVDNIHADCALAIVPLPLVLGANDDKHSQVSSAASVSSSSATQSPGGGVRP